jgi:arginase family enzyme
MTRFSLLGIPHDDSSSFMNQIRQPIVGADIVEYNPRCDISELTAVVAAKLLKEIAGMMLKNARPVDAR